MQIKIKQEEAKVAEAYATKVDDEAKRVHPHHARGERGPLQALVPLLLLSLIHI